MRSRWQASETVVLEPSALTELIQPLFPGEHVIACELASGGLSNTNIKLQIEHKQQPYLLRLYTRDGQTSGKEFAINKLTRAKVPSPEFLWHATTNGITGHPYVIMNWVEGQRLELVVNSLSASQLLTVARSVGAALAGVHGFTFAHTGFLSDELQPIEPLDLGAAGLRAYIVSCLCQEPGRSRVDERFVADLLEFFDNECAILSQWQCPATLAHCDFGGSNILIDRDESGEPKVAAILDFEFAFSAAPSFDFGNLLRKPLGAMPGFSDAVVAGYLANGGTLPQQWRKISLLSDLSAWADFLSRINPGEAVIADAKRVIAETMRNW